MSSNPFSPGDKDKPDQVNDEVNKQLGVTENKPTQAIGQAEGEQQQNKIIDIASKDKNPKVAEPTLETEAKEGDVVYVVEKGSHKLEITKEHGMNYEFHGKCSCGWEGRFRQYRQGTHNADAHIAARVG